MVEVFPYSGRQGGKVTDLEHARLWSPTADGVLPAEPATALQVGFAAGQWSVQPGRILIAGRILEIDAVLSGPLPGGAASTRRCVVAAYVNHADAPWTFGAELVAGTPGAGRPALSTSLTGRYQVGLHAVDIAPNGAITPLHDERPRLLRSGAMPATVEAAAFTNETSASTSWQNGAEVCDVTFVAPRSGKVMFHTYARCAGSTNPSAAALVAFSIRRGGPTGPVIREPTAEDGPIVRGETEMSMGVARLIAGLAPGEQYYARVAYRTSAQGVRVTISHRRLLVIPLEN